MDALGVLHSVNDAEGSEKSFSPHAPRFPLPGHSDGAKHLLGPPRLSEGGLPRIMIVTQKVL
jgi:hypothetical protein